MKRLFAAIKIEPSEAFLNIFDTITRSLRHEQIKWVELENMHLTLKFFGETDESRLPAIRKTLSDAARAVDPFELKLENVGIFGSRYDPRVLWLGIESNETLKIFADTIFAELDKAGWPRDRQNFVPHLTIGRIRQLNDKALFQQTIQQFLQVKIQSQHVDHLILYESILRREGPLYIKNSTFNLGGTNK